MDRQPAPGPWGGQPGTGGHGEEGPLFSLLKGGLRKAGSMMFPRSLSRAREWEHLCCGLCSGPGSGRSLGPAAAGARPAWRRLWPAGPRVGPSGWPAEVAAGAPPWRQGAQARQGSRGRPEARGRGSSPSTVCAQRLEKALAMPQAGPAATAPPHPGPFKMGICEHRLVPSGCLSWLQGNGGIICPPHSSPDPLLPLGILFKFK